MEEWNDGKTLLRVASLNIKEFWKDGRMEYWKKMLRVSD
jgi:hypothetical protein